MEGYNCILKEKYQEKRIEIGLTDAYGEDEEQEAFCCYLAEQTSFSFKAKIRGESNSKIFTVLRFTSITPHRVVCEVDINDTKSRMPITKIEPIEKDSPNEIVIT